MLFFFFFFQAEDGIRDHCVTGVQTCALPILDPEGVNSNAALTVPPFTNHGLIVLDNRLPSNVLESRLTVTGTLLNDTDGSIESRDTQLYGGSRFLAAQLDNRGTITALYPLTLQVGPVVNAPAGIIR